VFRYVTSRSSSFIADATTTCKVQAPRSLDRTLREIFGARGAGNPFRVAA